MDRSIQETLWRQFGASIDMLENAIKLCPPEFWDTEKYFWYNAYHGLFWLDYYLTLQPDTFAPPSPYTLSEFDASGKMPDRAYTKEELLAYLGHCREKCRDLILGMTDEIARSRWVNAHKDYSVLEILLYNMRHVQHHAAQLNLLLRQEIDDAPKWVSVTKRVLE
ncbi:DinB family protein [Maribacter arenosus]|uniref:DinB family protein n=1 Tax=Maribacter arenosus TaxID=1854708 RepID=A0ABR7VD91_9FLAO|nr:DinB family protein [Maribacter arenosus]MBD0850497.1 DinB family protein [Maribacter arenosus]